jgi:hypothetical protein
MHIVRAKYMALILFATTAILGCTSSPPAPPDNFTATMTTQGVEMPMARMGSKSRVENPGMNGIITIALGDAKKTIMMNKINKTYYEQSAQDREQMPTVYDSDVVFEKKKIGNEKIDDHPCVKYDAVYYRKSKPDEKHKAVIWEAQDLKGFPVQTEIIVPPHPNYPNSGGKMVMKYKNIKLGAATADLFEVPSDYKKVNSAQEVLGFGGLGNIEEMMKRIPKGQRPSLK